MRSKTHLRRRTRLARLVPTRAADETDALAALFTYGPKYASILAGTRLGFVPPKDLTQLVVVERLRGTATTDFGAQA